MNLGGAILEPVILDFFHLNIHIIEIKLEKKIQNYKKNNELRYKQKLK